MSQKQQHNQADQNRGSNAKKIDIERRPDAQADAQQQGSSRQQQQAAGNHSPQSSQQTAGRATQADAGTHRQPDRESHNRGKDQKADPNRGEPFTGS